MLACRLSIWRTLLIRLHPSRGDQLTGHEWGSAGLGRGWFVRRLGFEVARAMPIEPALAQPQAVAQHLLEHLPLHRADRSIGLRQGEIRTGMLLEDGAVA